MTLLAAEITLPSGIRLFELPAQTNTFEITAGYQTSDHVLNPTMLEFLLSTASARTMAVLAYGAGGRVESVSESGRSGIRVTGPLWLKPLIEVQLKEFFMETPGENPQLIARAIEISRRRTAQNFQAQVQDRLRAAELGQEVKWETLSQNDVEQSFSQYYGTDRGFVVSSVEVTAALESMPVRKSVRPESSVRSPVISRRISFEPGLPTGSVILATAIPSVYYEGWYA